VGHTVAPNLVQDPKPVSGVNCLCHAVHHYVE
jgi:hypothetical protein